jgi:hypothetical protein
MKGMYYFISGVAFILFISSIFLMFILPFEALSEMRLIYIIGLFFQMFFDFMVFLYYLYKGNEAKE